MRPSGGSGVSAVMPAISSAFEFTQALWPSALRRYTGRSGTISSSLRPFGIAPGKASIDQPPPRIQGSSGCAAA